MALFLELLTSNQRSFVVCFSSSRRYKHYSHRGILQGACRIWQELSQNSSFHSFLAVCICFCLSHLILVIYLVTYRSCFRFAQEHPEYSIEVVGHSLGAAAGALLTLVLKKGLASALCLSLLIHFAAHLSFPRFLSF